MNKTKEEPMVKREKKKNDMREKESREVAKKREEKQAVYKVCASGLGLGVVSECNAVCVLP